MKRILSTISFGSLLLIASTDLYARDDYKSHYQDTARVVDVEPIYNNRTRYRPRDCDRGHYRGNDYYPRRRFSENTSTITGAIIGGVIGNQFGGGNGKTAMTIAGTVLGGSVAKDNYRHRIPRDEPHYRDRGGERCHNNNGRLGYDRQRDIEAYRVSYRYNGQVFTTTMDHDPGNRIPIDVTVRPRYQPNNNRYNNW